MTRRIVYPLVRPRVVAHYAGMEQSPEQSIRQSDAQSPKRPVPPQFVGKNFQPGQSGNPRGGALRHDREAVQVERLTAAYIRRYGFAPDEVDTDTIAMVAKFNVRLKHGKLDDETAARLAMARDRALKSLGMTKALSRLAASSSSKVPMPSGYEARK
jgi:hypothetical protein